MVKIVIERKEVNVSYSNPPVLCPDNFYAAIIIRVIKAITEYNYLH